MATKLGKEKFTHGGEHIKGRTTNTGDYEMHLYYDVTDNYFFFDYKDVNNLFGTNFTFNNLFINCRTKNEAINVISTLFNEKSTTKRKLLVDINVPYGYVFDSKPGKTIYDDDIKTIKPNLNEHLLIIIKEGLNGGNGITLKYSKFIELEYNNNGKKLYAKCDNEWNYNKNDFRPQNSRNFIDWTHETEIFLENFNVQITNLINNVIEFFNTETEDDMFLKMKNSNNIISNQ